MTVLKDKIGLQAAKAFKAFCQCIKPKARYQKETEELFSSLYLLFESLAKDYNVSVIYEPLMVSVQRLDNFSQSQLNTADTKEQSVQLYARLMVATSFWALSIRAWNGLVEFFILPATEVPNLTQGELPSRSKLSLKLDSRKSQSWIMDGLLVSAKEMSMLMRSLFKDLITRSLGDFGLTPESLRLMSGGQSLTGSVRTLVAEKDTLVRKIVNQQEAIQNQLARELHDAVLGNVMLLKRSLFSGRRMSDHEMTDILDEISSRLREICQDLSPRDLKDCGLQVMLEDLCNNLSFRTGCDCNFECGLLPEFPYEVALHIYRIAQECFNNIAKHASATKVNLKIVIQDGILTMLIRDNGKGFNVDRPAGSTRYGGSGTSIIRERAELINYLYPTRVFIDSQSGTGTKTTLQVTLIPTEEAKHAD